MRIILDLHLLQDKQQHWFNEELWTKCFPYIQCSSVWTHDNKPFWTYTDFMESIKLFPEFCNSKDQLTNKLEMASFLANFHQETGDPSMEAPYPYSYPKNQKTGEDYEGPAGGGLAIMEGGIAQVILDEAQIPVNEIKRTIKINKEEQKYIGTKNQEIKSIVSSLKTINQPQFGLGQGTNGGAVLGAYYAVTDDGRLVNDTNSKETCNGPYCQYGGRGAIQLSYNYNYSDCSMALFNDLRLVQYPNLITTTDRNKFNGNPFYFGFPGPNKGGANKLPEEILSTTPPARRLAFMTSLWFWTTLRSGRKVSCHYCMVNWKTHGITSCNMIINNQSGCQESWASKKIQYYRRICKIFGIDPNVVEQSIICPVKIT